MRYFSTPRCHRRRFHRLYLPREQAGFSFTAVLVVLLIVLTGSLSLALRGGSGQLSAVLQTRKRSAVEVADAGATQIIGELNQLPNRRMLVSGRSMGTGALSWGDPTDDQQLNNRCAATVPRTTAATQLGSGSPRGLISGAADETYRYTLVRVRYSDRLRARWIESDNTGAAPQASTPNPFNNANNQLINLFPPATNVAVPNHGYIQLTVLGQVFDDDGTELSSGTITREFRVIPKPCGRSFFRPDGEHGNDELFADLSIRVFGPPGVNSAVGNNINLVTSELDSAGNFITPQTAIICLRANPGDCTAGGIECVDDAVPADGICDGVPVVTISNVDVDPPLPAPTLPAGTPPRILATDSADPDERDYLYLRVNQAGNDVEECKVTSPGSPPSLADCRNADFCLPDTTPNRVADFNCVFDQIYIGSGEQLTVDTTPANIDGNPGDEDVRIALYFVGNPSPDPSLQVATNGALLHRKCSSFTGLGTGCSTPAQLIDYAKLALYGSQPFHDFELSGSSSAANVEPLPIFLYTRAGTIDLGSGFMEILGALWSDSLELSGNVTVVAPPMNLPGSDNDPNEYFNRTATLNGRGFYPADFFFDWIARSTTAIRYFN